MAGGDRGPSNGVVNSSRGQQHQARKQRRQFRLLAAEEVATTRRQKGLQRGYLPAGSLKLCLKAFFIPNNEFTNSWTSVLAVALFAWYLWTSESLISDNTANILPYQLTVLSMLLSWIMSLLGHTFMSYSANVADFFFCLDYAGLSGLPIGVSMSMGCYTFPQFTPQPLLGGLYFPLAASFGILSSAISCCTRLPRMHNFPHKLTVRAVSQSIPYTWVMMPLALYGCPAHHRCHPLLCLAAVVFYVTRWPETLYPGRCDFWFHSHTGFHILSSMSLSAILLAISKDIPTSPPLTANSLWWVQVGYGCAMALVFAVAVVFATAVVTLNKPDRPWAPCVYDKAEWCNPKENDRNGRAYKSSTDVISQLRLNSRHNNAPHKRKRGRNGIHK